MDFEVIVVGAGAAGFMAAIEVAKTGKKTALINSTDKIAEKIRISGGGRCNFTNLGAGPENYISDNPHFCKSALANYTQHDFIKLVEKHRIKFYEKKLGQLFCKESSQAIINMLLKEAEEHDVELIYPMLINKIIRKEDEKFELTTKQHEVFYSNSVVIATGGLSIPQTGASHFGYRLAESFGLNIIEPRPGLVPLVINDKFVTSQPGSSFDALTSFNKIKFRENILLTHRGLSGPAILQISNYAKPGELINIDLCPDLDLKAILLEAKGQGEKKKLKNFLHEKLFPEKFINQFENKFDLNKTLAETSNKYLEEITYELKNWQVRIDDTEGYAKAEVTLGGVDTKELNSKTMESKKIPGLYFIGEVVDLTGWLGGYNFQWAWSSGFAAAQAINQ